MDITILHEHSKPEIEVMPLEELAAFVIEAEGRPATSACSLSFVTNDEIAQLNADYRGKEGPTDVLSFECDGIDDGFDDAFGEGSLDDAYQLGDIVIASDVAAAQAVEYDNTLEEEIELLVVHGLLHLCGWDHMNDTDAEAMEARERELLSRWRAR